MQVHSHLRKSPNLVEKVMCKRFIIFIENKNILHAPFTI
jgi:hypothetical protein